MKFQYILIIAIIFVSTQTVFSIKSLKRASLRQENNQAVLPSTPKGQDLANNFGQPADNKIFGAVQQQQASSQQTQLTVLQANGKTAQITVNNKDLNQVKQNKCAINLDPHYQICAALNDCDLCSNSDVCGWCASSKQCLPGNIGNAACPGDCISHWLFERGSCTGKVKSGTIGNVSPNATKLITPEYAEPKIRVNTHTTEHITVNKQVQVGVQSFNQTTKVQAANGTLVSQTLQKQTPIMGNVQQQIPINSKTESATYSLANGKQLDNQQQAKQTFGTEAQQAQAAPVARNH